MEAGRRGREVTVKKAGIDVGLVGIKAQWLLISRFYSEYAKSVLTLYLLILHLDTFTLASIQRQQNQ